MTVTRPFILLMFKMSQGVYGTEESATNFATKRQGAYGKYTLYGAPLDDEPADEGGIVSAQDDSAVAGLEAADPDDQLTYHLAHPVATGKKHAKREASSYSTYGDYPPVTSDPSADDDWDGYSTYGIYRRDDSRLAVRAPEVSAADSVGETRSFTPDTDYADYGIYSDEFHHEEKRERRRGGKREDAGSSLPYAKYGKYGKYATYARYEDRQE